MSCGFRLQREEPPHSPRLFECSNQTGQFKMTEVDDFAQSDLDEEDVMLLDTWEEVRGPDASSSEEIQPIDGSLYLCSCFFYAADFLVGRKLSKRVRDQRGVAQFTGVPEDPPGGSRPRHTHHLRQARVRAAHVHRVVQRLGSA